MNRAVGDVVAYREVWRGKVWAARPLVVARDDEELTALWFPKGTIWKRPIPPRSHGSGGDRGQRLARCLLAAEWELEDAEWEVSTLLLVRPGDWHATWVSWLDDGTQWGWYINLQEPVRRTELGWETMDLVLDVVVENDRTWRWKDEDELATYLELGALDEQVAGRIRQEGLGVASRAERNEPPFSEPWGEWRPDPSWPIPVLPEGWDVPCR